MRSIIVIVTAIGLGAAGCAQNTAGGGQGGPVVDPTVATIGCGIAGGVIGAQFGQGQGQIVGGVIGALVGAGLCNWLANRSFSQMDPGETDCVEDAGAQHCLVNVPPPVAGSSQDACVDRVLVQFAETGEDAWRCRKANGDVDYYPVA